MIQALLNFLAAVVGIPANWDTEEHQQQWLEQRRLDEEDE